MRSILASGLDSRAELETGKPPMLLPPHDNISGQEFYN
jgi:hypothetical protein